MSTQIRYKGIPITTIEKGTVTLKTEDFGLEGDIEVVSEGGGDNTPWDGDFTKTGEPTSGGSAPDINGIIREYKVNAGASVNAGDFVEFVTKFGNGKFSSNVVSDVSACKLDNSRVLVAYRDGGNSNYGTAVVLSIENGNTIVGTKLVFCEATTNYISACTLTDNKVLVAYQDNGNSNYGTVVVLKINDRTITKVIQNVFHSGTTDSISVSALSKNKVLVAYENEVATNSTSGTTYKRYGTSVILNIDESTLNIGTKARFSESTPSYISTCALTESKALVTYSYYASNGYFDSRANVLTINGTTISVGEKTVLHSGYCYHTAVIALSEEKAFSVVNYCHSSASQETSAAVLTIDGTTISKGTQTTFLSNSTQNYIGVVPLTGSKVLVSYCDVTNSYYGTAKVFTIDGTTITGGVAKVFDYNHIYCSSLIAFSETSALVIWNNGFGQYSTLSVTGTTITVDNDEQATYIQPASSNLHNVGVAKTSGSEGDTVEVYCAV